MPTADLPFIPETITVHLGTPNSNAPNVTVTFPEYIKNVASSEIYPTWPEASLRANIYSQISFALNRVYTEWYRSQGYDFDITSSTQFDQAFVNGREIFSNISKIVDEIFNNYVVRQGSVEPLFTAFCNGTTVTCEGLSQWGTVGLANRGLTPYEILQYYFGNDINIVKNAPIGANVESYPGVPLGIGSVGNEVKKVQTELNRISRNYPAIQRIPEPDGVYKIPTENAVRTFQQVFNLTPSGIVDKATWYKINRVFTAVKGLSELESEGLSLEEVTSAFPEELEEGDYGNIVRNLQYFLNVIAYFNDEIPLIRQLGVFGEDTVENVRAFQQYYGLPVTGIVNLATWNIIKRMYDSILISLQPGYEGRRAKYFPGYVLFEGLQNNDVRDLQTYLNVVGQNLAAVPAIPVTGYYGQQTANAVRAFQQAYGIPVTGRVDAVTWDAIAQEYNYIVTGDTATLQ